MKISFDLEGMDKSHCFEWKRLIAQASNSNDGFCQFVSTKSDADVALLPAEPPCSGADRLRIPKSLDLPIFVWEQSDHPTGRQNGFYGSLPRVAFDRTRHRTIHYPLTYN